MYLGLDLGTSGLRGVLATENCNVIAEAEHSVSTHHNAPNWSEQNPEDWITACKAVMKELADKSGDELKRLRAIGLSGHMHGAVLVDNAGHPLRHCIMWNDTRSAAQAAALDQGPVMRGVSGNIVFPGFTAPKLAWVRDHEPDLFDRVAKVLLPKDFLRLWLTGEYISEMSDAAGTSWLDTAKRDWSIDALAQTGLVRDQMPNLVEGSDKAGVLRAALTDEWGIEGKVIIAGGAADNAAAACGVGCLNEGTGFVSLGTSGVLLTARDRFEPSPETAVHSFCHAVPNRWYQMGVILAATDSLNWWSRITGKSAAELSGAVGDTISGPSDLKFLPYLSGERTPHNDAYIRGGFIGLDVSHTQEDMTQAVLEGVAFALRDNLEVLKAVGVKPETLLAVGGGARSEFWLQTIATLLDVELSIPKNSDLGAALGALRLAICADTGAAPEDIMTLPEIGTVILPNKELLPSYEDGYAAYAQLYPALSKFNKT